jgi:hypothetical protein
MIQWNTPDADMNRQPHPPTNDVQGEPLLGLTISRRSDSDAPIQNPSSPMREVGTGGEDRTDALTTLKYDAVMYWS